MLFLRTIPLLFIIIILAGSCSTERSLARHFVNERAPKVNVLVLPPPEITKNYYPINPDSLPADASRDYDLSQENYLFYVDDSLLVELFIENLTAELEEYNVEVYSDQSIDSFFQLDSNAYIFSAAQVQILEYADLNLDYAMVDTTIYEAETEITTLVFNTWFEYTELNQPQKQMEVLFSMQHRSDYISGKFFQDWLTGRVTYEYIPYRLTVDDVYDLASLAGQQNARYIFDFLLNQYVSERSGKKIDSLGYFHYNRFQKSLNRANQQRFYQYPSSDN